MRTIPNLTFRINTQTFLPLALLLSITMAGCSQHQQWHRVEQPGSYDLTNMGDKDLDGERVRVTKVNDKIFLSYIEIDGPSFFSTYLLKHTEINKGESVLDMGTGSGIQAIFAAKNARHVLATDVSERALKNTLLNARRHGVDGKITVRKSDLFNNIKPTETFDVIIVNIPFPWYDESEENWKLMERFFRDAGGHLKQDGRIYFLAGILNNLQRTKELIESNNLKILRIDMTYIDNKDHDYELFVYLIKHASSTNSRENEHG